MKELAKQFSTFPKPGFARRPGSLTNPNERPLSRGLARAPGGGHRSGVRAVTSLAGYLNSEKATFSATHLAKLWWTWHAQARHSPRTTVPGLPDGCSKPSHPADLNRPQQDSRRCRTLLAQPAGQGTRQGARPHTVPQTLRLRSPQPVAAQTRGRRGEWAHGSRRGCPPFRTGILGSVPKHIKCL